MKTKTMVAFTLLALCCTTLAHADTFGDGANAFDIEFVNVGSARNPHDNTGSPNPAGMVNNAYRMGKFEVSEDMINKANNLGGLGITHDHRGASKPATSISWFEAANFINWLNTCTGHTPAYKFDSFGNFELWQSGDVGYDPSNLYRNRRAYYFLPSVDEWYKAAYYDPSGVYYDYPTGSNSDPDGIDFAGDATFDAVFIDGGSNLEPNDIMDVGLLSPYGTAGQGGNVWELQEADFDLLNDSTSSIRITRGGNWEGSSIELLASTLTTDLPTHEHLDVGFRVASIPEPSALWIGGMASGALLLRRRGVARA